MKSKITKMSKSKSRIKIRIQSDGRAAIQDALDCRRSLLEKTFFRGAKDDPDVHIALGENVLSRSERRPWCS
jgi:hypothetical protein